MKISLGISAVLIATAFVLPAEGKTTRMELATAEPAAPSAPAVPAANAAAEATPQGKAEKFGDWAFVCPPPDEDADKELGVCRLVQSAILNVEAKDGGEPHAQRVMLTAIGYAKDQEQAILTVIVPLGILLPPGVLLDAEGYDQLRLPVQRCDANGCLAFVTMKEQLVEAFRKGTEAHITFFNVAGKPNKIRISLEGFTKGLAQVRAGRQ
jgi:invasion protein IalB